MIKLKNTLGVFFLLINVFGAVCRSFYKTWYIYTTHSVKKEQVHMIIFFSLSLWRGPLWVFFHSVNQNGSREPNNDIAGNAGIVVCALVYTIRKDWIYKIHTNNKQSKPHTKLKFLCIFKKEKVNNWCELHQSVKSLYAFLKFPYYSR